jgi:O-antigen/teichoic acid export membrane protein
MIVNVLLYFFQVIVSRNLGPQDYGLFAALFGIIYFASSLSNAIRTSIAKLVAGIDREYQNANSMLASIISYMLLFVLFLYLVFGFTSRWIQLYVHSESILPIILTGFAILASLLLSITQGIFQGRQRFLWLSNTSLIQAGGRLAIIPVVLIFNLGVSGILGAVGLVSLLCSFIGVLVIRPTIWDRFRSLPYRTVTSILFPSAVGFLVLSIPTSLDLVIVRNLFPDEQSGIYAGTSLLGRIVLFASSGVAVVVFPKMARDWQLGRSIRRWLYAGLGLTILLSGGICLLFTLFPTFSISIILGSEYTAVNELLPIYTLAMFLFALVIIFVHYFLATGQAYLIYGLVLPHVCLEISLIYTFHQGLMDVIWIILGTNTSLVILSTLLTALHRSQPAPSAVLESR